MIVVAGGMIRSGSTFAFNIVRELLLPSGTVRAHSSNDLEVPEDGPADGEHIVIKTHSPNDRLLDAIKAKRLHCVCTVRRPEDAVASWWRAFDFPVDHGVAMVKLWQRWYREVSDRVLTVDYDVIESSPKTAIRTIASYLGAAPDAATVDRLAERYERTALKQRFDRMEKDAAAVDIGFSYYDPETFFHRRHITSLPGAGVERQLAPDQLQWVREALAAR